MPTGNRTSTELLRATAPASECVTGRRVTRRTFLAAAGGGVLAAAVGARPAAAVSAGVRCGGGPLVALEGVGYGTVVSQGIRLVVGSAGPVGARGVVLVHGGLIEHSWWRAQVGPLVAAGYRVVLPNLPGHGGSDPQPLHDPADSYDVNARALADVIDALTLDRPLVVGWSAGGLSLGRGLGPGGALEDRIGAAMFTGTFARGAAVYLDPGLAPSIALALAGSPATFVARCAAPADHVIGARVRHQLETGTHPHVSAPPRILAATMTNDNSARIRASSVPITVVHGRDDRAVRLAGAREIAELAGVELIELDHGHATFLTDPDPFTSHARRAASNIP